LENKKQMFREIVGPVPRAAGTREKNKYPVNALPLAIFTLPRDISYECRFKKGVFVQIHTESKDSFWVAELLFDVMFNDKFLLGLRWYEGDGDLYKQGHIETKIISIFCVKGTIEMKEIVVKSKRWKIENIISYTVNDGKAKKTNDINQAETESNAEKDDQNDDDDDDDDNDTDDDDNSDDEIEMVFQKDD